MLRPSRTRTEGSRSPRVASTALGMLSFIGLAAGLGAVAADDGGVSGPGTTAVDSAVDASASGVGDAVRAGEIGDAARAGEVGDAVRAAGTGDPVRGSAKSSTRGLSCGDAAVETMPSGVRCACVAGRGDRQGALTWRGGERSPCR